MEQKKADSTITKSIEVVEHAGRSLNVHDLVTGLMKTLGGTYSSSSSSYERDYWSRYTSTSLIAFPDGTNRYVPIETCKRSGSEEITFTDFEGKRWQGFRNSQQNSVIYKHSGLCATLVTECVGTLEIPGADYCSDYCSSKFQCKSSGFSGSSSSVTPSVKIAKSASGNLGSKNEFEYKVDPTTLVLSLTFWQCASAEEKWQAQVKADAERKKRTEQVTAAITSNEKAMAKATESGDLSDVGALYLERKRLDEELRQLQTTPRQSFPVKEYGAQFNIQPFSSFCGVVWNPYLAPTLTRPPAQAARLQVWLKQSSHLLKQPDALLIMTLTSRILSLVRLQVGSSQ
eukprot:g49669.t1